MKKILSFFLVVATIFSVMIVPVQAASETALVMVCKECGDSFYFISCIGTVNIHFYETYFEVFEYGELVECLDYDAILCSCCDGKQIVGFERFEDAGSMDVDICFPDILTIAGGGKCYIQPVFEEVASIRGIITGDPVPNAEYYQLYEKRDSNYVLVRTNGELYFDLNEIMLEPGYDMPGDYTFVVVACGEGFESSDYSNEVVYTAK